MYNFKINLKGHLYFGNTTDKMKHAEHIAWQNSVHNFVRMKQFFTTLCELGIHSYYKAKNTPTQTSHLASV